MVKQAQGFPAASVGIQVPVGRIAAGRSRWQTVLQARDTPMVYRLHAIDGLIVEVDGAARMIHADPGASVDVQAKKIRVKAATGSGGHVAQGWYVLVS
ncbi:MAG: hypothetical protein A3D94_00310 [Alphaproteobacteria bacterium RIFCSPHIGHO2_12_FULL_66_14]|jgi:hypothetical protein|nr:MAG: hypothetical protein A3D94_00310 [Alphaproteobacteria bacterium RIFCSPHIGHO2_12_FULL_66_14]